MKTYTTTRDRRVALFEALRTVKGNSLQWLIALMSIKQPNLDSLLLPESYRFLSLKLIRREHWNVLGVLSFYDEDLQPSVVFGGGHTPIAALSNLNSQLAKGNVRDDEYNVEYASSYVQKTHVDKKEWYRSLLDLYKDSFHKFDEPPQDIASED
jgi:hypothetical protein